MTSPRRWVVPVLNPRFEERKLELLASRGKVMFLPLAEPVVVPPQSDDLLIAAVREAREVAERDGQDGGS